MPTRSRSARICGSRRTKPALAHRRSARGGPAIRRARSGIQSHRHEHRAVPGVAGTARCRPAPIARRSTKRSPSSRRIRVKSANPEWRARFLSARYAPYEARIAAEFAGADAERRLASVPHRRRGARPIARRRTRGWRDRRNRPSIRRQEELRARLTSQQLRSRARIQRQDADEAGTLALAALDRGNARAARCQSAPQRRSRGHAELRFRNHWRRCSGSCRRIRRCSRISSAMAARTPGCSRAASCGMPRCPAESSCNEPSAQTDRRAAAAARPAHARWVQCCLGTCSTASPRPACWCWPTGRSTACRSRRCRCRALAANC